MCVGVAGRVGGWGYVRGMVYGVVVVGMHFKLNNGGCVGMGVNGAVRMQVWAAGGPWRCIYLEITPHFTDTQK